MQDLKPSNIVANEHCVLKILDFGLARKRTFNSDVRMSDYVVTRYYRAPEVILGLPYDEKGEAHEQGRGRSGRVERRLHIRGIDQPVGALPGHRPHRPVDEDRQHPGDTPRAFHLQVCPSLARKRRLGSSAGAYVRSMPRKNAQSFGHVIPDRNFLAETENEKAGFTAVIARDLLEKMLKVDPEERLTVDECINHPYVRMWIREEEVNAPQSENRYDPDIDFAEKTLSEWKGLLSPSPSRSQI